MSGNENKISGGCILLARTLLQSSIMGKPPLYTKLWLWMLLQARYKDHGHLKRGQFKTSIEMMRDAMTYDIGYRPMKPTKKEIRSAYDFLMKGNMIGSMKVTHGMIITILNYDYYQDLRNYEGHHEGDDEGSSRGTIYNKEREKKGNILPEKISAEISSLQSKYSSDVLDQVFQAICSTRKSSHISDGIRLKILQSWKKYPVHQVEAGIRIYLDKECASQGKDEKYLLGIIRNQNCEPVRGMPDEPDQMIKKSSGSLMLDDHFRSRGYRIIS